jgi:hypothetical protein
MARRLEIEDLLQAVEEGLGRLFLDAHGAVALHVGGRAPGTGRAGRPICPRIIIRLDSIWMVCTACLCWVRPMPQVQMTRSPLM